MGIWRCNITKPSSTFLFGDITNLPFRICLISDEALELVKRLTSSRAVWPSSLTTLESIPHCNHWNTSLLSLWYSITIHYAKDLPMLDYRPTKNNNKKHQLRNKLCHSSYAISFFFDSFVDHYTCYIQQVK